MIMFKESLIPEFLDDKFEISIFRDKKLEKLTLEQFLVIEEVNFGKIKDFLSNLIKERVLGVRIRTGLLNWYKTFFGLKKDSVMAGKVNEKILEKTYLMISNCKVLYSAPSKSEILQLLKKMIGKDYFSSSKMVVIKLFSFLFPQFVMPIFKIEHYVKFINIFDSTIKIISWEDACDNGMKLKRYCDRFFGKYMKEEDYVHFLYHQGIFLKNPEYKKKLLKYNFASYPLEEQTVIGLFYTIINQPKEKIPEQLLEFGDFVTYHLKTTYPDLIGRLKLKTEMISIEFEYNSSGYKSHLNEDLIADYVVCWEEDIDRAKLVHNNGKSPKKVIALKDCL